MCVKRKVSRNTSSEANRSVNSLDNVIRMGIRLEITGKIFPRSVVKLNEEIRPLDMEEEINMGLWPLKRGTFLNFPGFSGKQFTSYHDMAEFRLS